MGPAGQKAWQDVGGAIHRNGYFADLDLHAFERFCRLHDELAECEETIEDDGAYRTNPQTGAIVQHPAVNRRFKILDLMRRYEIEFWLTPTARAGKQVAKKEESGISSRQRTG
jgi:P27 family predicted phage terminase small subunit